MLGWSALLPGVGGSRFEKERWNRELDQAHGVKFLALSCSAGRRRMHMLNIPYVLRECHTGGSKFSSRINSERNICQYLAGR